MADFSGQKQVWLLDLQVDDLGKEFIMFIMQWQCNQLDLFSEGTQQDQSGAVQLCKFVVIACGAVKVLDASVVPADGGGAWSVLTEKAGVWAVPASVVLGGKVEASERNLSHHESGKPEIENEERSQDVSGEALSLQRSNSEAAQNMDRSVVSRSSQHEETEAIVGRLIQQFLSCGQAHEAFEKLQRAGVFERDGDTNAFARTCPSLVDPFAKHWASGGGSGLAITATVSSQLAEKQKRHEQCLNFLAVSKCHEELHNNQRMSINEILEHGEKLASLVALRELTNTCAHPKPASPTMLSEYENAGDMGGALLDLVQLEGVKARRTKLVVMDRDKVEVFYTTVECLGSKIFLCAFNSMLLS